MSIRSYEESTVGQAISSANTSINSKRLPAVFSKVDFQPGTINLDIGGGKFDNVAEHLALQDVANYVMDPYNRTEEHNNRIFELIRYMGGADTITISNVLNVIAEEPVRAVVLHTAYDLLSISGTLYITIYKAPKTGITKAGYQLGRDLREYLEEVREIFPNAVVRGSMIVATI